MSNSDSCLVRGCWGFLLWTILATNGCHDLAQVVAVIHASPHVWTYVLCFTGLHYVEAAPKYRGDNMGPHKLASCSVRNKRTGSTPSSFILHTLLSCPAKSALPDTWQWLGSTYNDIQIKLKKTRIFTKYLVQHLLKINVDSGELCEECNMQPWSRKGNL